MLRRTRTGQGMVEYALIVSMMAMVIIGAATAVGLAVQRTHQKAADNIDR
ncbi:MAG: Flp family type IVb pilin [Candidatus Wallbacteria bacterium]|nr:Flp family type IVb pilin [Candidatus Wallbacteria bacterium]MBI4869606.1 Flp family type IVb pilin [Candidatus Wallbacteria bacterium]